MFAKMVVGRVSVSRTCDILGIGLEPTIISWSGCIGVVWSFRTI